MSDLKSQYDGLAMTDVYGVLYYGVELIKCVVQINTSYYDLLDEDKKKKLTSFVASKAQESVDCARQLVAEKEKKDERQKYINSIVELVVSCGFEVLRVEVFANRYSSDPAYYAKPWIKLHTNRGPLLIGARKRVTVLDWSESWIIKTAEDLFRDEKVTKEGRMIHAWMHTSKLEEYLDCLYTSPISFLVEM